MCDRYRVVFKGAGIGEGGNYKGLITYANFDDKSDFEEYKKTSDCVDEVLEEGVSKERAIELVRTTKTAAYVHAAVDGSTMSDGSVNVEIFISKLKVYLPDARLQKMH